MTLLDRAQMALAWDQLIHVRKSLFALFVSLIPFLVGGVLLIADLTGQSGRSWMWAPDFAEPLRFIVLAGTVPLTALLLSGATLADEVEDRTLTYLLVRPTHRAALYTSRLTVVGLAAMALAAFQALSLGLMRLLSYLLTGSGQTVETGSGTVDGGLLVASLIPAGMVTAALLAGVLCALFGAVSVVLPRYHFVANLLIYLAWELPFGQLGGAGPGVLTATYYAHSLMIAADPTDVGFGFYRAAPWWLAAPVLLAAGAFWVFIGAQLTRRRDFNVTSAAT